MFQSFNQYFLDKFINHVDMTSFGFFLLRIRTKKILFNNFGILPY